jgi:hypothetical protein
MLVKIWETVKPVRSVSDHMCVTCRSGDCCSEVGYMLLYFIMRLTLNQVMLEATRI